MFVDSKMAATNSKHALIPSGVMMIPKEADAQRPSQGFPTDCASAMQKKKEFYRCHGGPLAGTPAVPGGVGCGVIAGGCSCCDVNAAG